MKLRNQIAVALLLAMLVTSSAAAQTVGRGDFEFFVDTAAFRGESGTTVEQVYLRIPNPEIRFKESKGRLEARVRIRFLIRDDKGHSVVDETVDFEPTAESVDESTSPLRFQTLQKDYTLDPGRYELTCVVNDRNSPKVTLVGMMKKETKHSVVHKLPLDVPEFSSETVQLSDPKFLWSIERRRGKAAFVSNPPRLYGLYKDSLSVYMEAYVPNDVLSGGDLFIETEILDEGGEIVKTSYTDVAAADVATRAGSPVVLPVILTEDLNQLPAGSYSLYVGAGVADQLLVRLRAGVFSVAWDLRSWEISRRNLIAEARFLLDDGDFNEFVTLSIGEQETKLHEMWQEIDPDPLTGVNEAYEEFIDRLEYVNARYSDYQSGFLTDRGIIYLKYGAPDEMIVEVIPMNRETLSDALEKVRDRFHSVNYSSTGGARGNYARPSRDLIADPRRIGAVGEGGNVAYAYELWIYNDSGTPILKHDKVLEPDIGLRFIFIDREGYGRYKLESSSSMANK